MPYLKCHILLGKNGNPLGSAVASFPTELSACAFVGGGALQWSVIVALQHFLNTLSGELDGII